MSKVILKKAVKKAIRETGLYKNVKVWDVEITQDYKGDNWMNVEVSANKLKTPRKINTFSALKKNWNSLPDDVKTHALGRPNFKCGAISKRLKEFGFNIPDKSEYEQAATIFIMMEFYREDPKNWKENFNKFLNS